jgi:hypothetical protein
VWSGITKYVILFQWLRTRIVKGEFTARLSLSNAVIHAAVASAFANITVLQSASRAHSGSSIYKGHASFISVKLIGMLK